MTCSGRGAGTEYGKSPEGYEGGADECKWKTKETAHSWGDKGQECLAQLAILLSSTLSDSASCQCGLASGAKQRPGGVKRAYSAWNGCFTMRVAQSFISMPVCSASEPCTPLLEAVAIAIAIEGGSQNLPPLVARQHSHTHSHTRPSWQLVALGLYCGL